MSELGKVHYVNEMFNDICFPPLIEKEKPKLRWKERTYYKQKIFSDKILKQDKWLEYQNASGEWEKLPTSYENHYI